MLARAGDANLRMSAGRVKEDHCVTINLARAESRSGIQEQPLSCTSARVSCKAMKTPLRLSVLAGARFIAYVTLHHEREVLQLETT